VGGLGGWFVENRLGQEHVSTQNRQHDQNNRKKVLGCVRRVQTCFVLGKGSAANNFKASKFITLDFFTGLCGSTPGPVISLGQKCACLKISCNLGAVNRILPAIEITVPHGLATLVGGGGGKGGGGVVVVVAVVVVIVFVVAAVVAVAVRLAVLGGVVVMVMVVGVVVVVVTLVVMVRIFVLCFAGMVCKDRQFLAILLGSATCIASLISEVSSKGDMVSSIFVVKTGRPAAGNVLHVLCDLFSHLARRGLEAYWILQGTTPPQGAYAKFENV